MPDTFLKILGFGLIGETTDRSEYRYVQFEDQSSRHKVELLLNKKQKPQLWSEIEKLEKEKDLHLLKSYIFTFRGKDYVVTDGENIQESLFDQHMKVKIEKIISIEEAEIMKQDSKGFCTNLTFPGAMEIAWSSIDKKTKLIRFRQYSGNGNFDWSNWFEILD